MIAIGAGYTAAKGVEKFPKVQSSMKTIGMKCELFSFVHSYHHHHHACLLLYRDINLSN